MSAERKHREEIVRYGRMLHERGLVAAMDGNLSVRLNGDRILVTPTCVSKGAMRAGDMVMVDLEGTAGGRPAQRDQRDRHAPADLPHAARRSGDRARASAHRHRIRGRRHGADQPLVCEVVMGLGCIPLARYGTPGTSELARLWSRYVPHYDAILMSNHGVVAYGDTLEHAYMKMETVEHFAQIALVTHLLGRQQPLQEVEVAETCW
jgi:L-fuculose-phosphate aldolase